jgi:hypothetical protein
LFNLIQIKNPVRSVVCKAATLSAMTLKEFKTLLRTGRHWRISSGSLAMFTAILRAALPKSCRGAGLRVVPRALRHTPCVMTILTGLLDCLTAKDNESNHHNDCK